MRVRIWGMVLMAVSVCSLHARVKEKRVVDTLVADAVVKRFADSLAATAFRVDTVTQPVRVGDTYYFPLFGPPTLYRAPLRQSFGVNWQPSLPGRSDALPALQREGDRAMRVWEEENDMLMQTYVGTPVFIGTTEQQLQDAGSLYADVQPKDPHPELSELPEYIIDLADDIDAEHLVVRRPNFWTFKGDYALQFTQSHFSENWYQGGENNYSMLALATMEANFDNKQKLQWDNRLEMRLGFQTIKEDEFHKYRTNDDLLRFTTKIGYQATKHWFYTLQMQAYTQFYPSYKSNSMDVKSAFMSPFNLVLSLGMDFKLNLKRFNGSAILAPVAYNFRYVSREELYGQFGLEEDCNKYHNFGPNITVKYTWKIWNNITWDARIYWFSNLEMTDIEWENTFTFSFSKYLNTKLFLYPRIDDSAPKYKNENERYFMFKEWFSLGVNYSF